MRYCLKFDKGTNQIPSQNQTGLDAEGIMWYKNGIWCDSETDTDEDDLPDYMELLLGTNINNPDTDDDGLPDGEEVEISRYYRNNGAEVSVCASLHSDPYDEDSDGDGDLDDIDPEPLKYQLNGYFIEQLQRLYDLAISYQAFPDVTGLFNTNVEDWLTFMFI